MRRSIALTHGPQARKRSATAWSVMDSYRAVKVPATSRKDLSKPQYKKTTRKSCAGVLTFLARTNALNARAICTVSGGRSCKSSSKSVSGSVRGNCMRHFSCRWQGKSCTLCSMPSFSLLYSLSWRKWGQALGLSQPAGIGRDHAIAARIAPLAEVAKQAHRVVAPGIPALQEIRLIEVEATVAEVTATFASRKRGGLEIALHRAQPQPDLLRNGRGGPALVVQGPDLRMQRLTVGLALGGALLCRQGDGV